MNDISRNLRSLALHLDRSSRAMARAVARKEPAGSHRSGWLTGPIREAQTGPLADWMAPELSDELERLLEELEDWKRGDMAAGFLRVSAEAKRLRDALLVHARNHETVSELVHDLLDAQADESSTRGDFSRAFLRAASVLRAGLQEEPAKNERELLFPRLVGWVYDAERDLMYRGEKVERVFSRLRAAGYRVGRGE